MSLARRLRIAISRERRAVLRLLHRADVRASTVLAVGLLFSALASGACGPRRYTLTVTETSTVTDTFAQPAPRRGAATPQAVEPRDAARQAEDSSRGTLLHGQQSEFTGTNLREEPLRPQGMQGSSDVEGQRAGLSGDLEGRSGAGGSPSVTSGSQAPQDGLMSLLPGWLPAFIMIGLAVLFVFLALGRVRS